jgi:3-hydroxyacyl-CoA dehydrogenase / enoyl-CoA hydratase / 3-hydroxybutyryl-CoA epimerase
MKVAPLFDAIYGNKELRGKKTGLGFYEHNGSKKSVNPMISSMIKLDGCYLPRRLTQDDIVDRLVLIMVNEAARCLEESIVGKVDYLDMAMLLGTGFPPFRGGLCAYADSRNISVVVARLKGLSNVYGSRFKPADLLVKMAEEDTRFYS